MCIVGWIKTRQALIGRLKDLIPEPHHNGSWVKREKNQHWTPESHGTDSRHSRSRRRDSLLRSFPLKLFNEELVLGLQ